MPPGISVPDLPRALATGAQSASAPRAELKTAMLNVTLASPATRRLMKSLRSLKKVMSKFSVGEVVEGRHAVRLGPDADRTGARDAIVLLLDVRLAVEEDLDA